MPAQFEQAELLKQQYTDKYVVVKSGAPELRRFQGLTGVVKTVNMSCRALVLFDGPADIGWYDIDPSFLTIVAEPQPKQPADAKAAKATKEPTAAKAAPAAIPAPAVGGKKASPLDLIRQQGAVGAKPPAAPATGGAKPSPLDLIRQQGAAGAKPAAAPATSGAKPSPLDLIRQQGAMKTAGAPVAVAASDKPKAVAATVQATEVKPAPVAVAPKPAATTSGDDKNLSPIELIRRQGAFKGN